MKKYINLLPPEEQKGLRYEAIQKQLKRFGFRLLSSFIILAGILFLTDVFLNQELGSVQGELNTENQTLEKLKDPKTQKEIEVFNQNLKNLKFLTAGKEDWSLVLEEFAKVMPKDITVDDFEIQAGYKVIVKGRAGNRGSVLELRSNLLDSDFFENINFPLANLEKSQNTEWSYSFSVKKDKLKE